MYIQPDVVGGFVLVRPFGVNFRLPLWFCLTVIACVSVRAESLLRSEDRIVFVGDSITGQGGNGGPDGWTGMIADALCEADPRNQQTLVALGGSGMTVNAWVGTERKSREKPTVLDVKKYDVQQELGRPADVVVVMLGMNDVLSPQQEDSDAGYEKFAASYRSLIAALRERTAPRVFAIAAPTPCTEDRASPKNAVMDRMVEHLAKLAAEEGCVLLPVRAAAWEMLDKGRRVTPDFHITTDEVHPNAFGHLAIATGMLRGLGETEAAALLMKRAESALDKRKDPAGLSHEIALIDGDAPSDAALRFRVTVYGASHAVALETPEGLSVVSTEGRERETVFMVSGVPDRIVNTLRVRDGEHSRAITVPAPWLTGTGNARSKGWNRGVFEPASGRLPSDDTVRTGQDFKAKAPSLELADGVPVKWKPFVGGVNYGGKGAPGVIDFAAITYFRNGETGYGLRWIHSENPREVIVRMRRTGFAGVSHLEVWVNGETVLAGDPAKAEKREAVVALKHGWNLVSFKSNFWQWQWQFAVELEPVAGDTLDDLRYSITPPSF